MNTNEEPGWLPLHPFQEAILLDQARDFSDPRYNVGGYFQMPANVDCERLSCALQLCAERHDALRIQLRLDADGAVQRFSSNTPEVGRLALRDEPAALEYMRARMEIPFDLRSGEPLAEFCLIGLEAGSTLMFVRAHHISLDQSAFQALIQSVNELYNDPQATDAAPSYADEIFKAHAYLESDDYAADESRWRSWLEEHSERLGSAFPATATSVVRRGYVSRRLSPRYQASLEHLQSSLGVSLVHITLSALSVCLAGFYGRREFIAGLAAHGRITRRERRVVGVLVNVVPNLVRHDPAATVADFVSSVRNGAMRDLRMRAFPMHHLHRMFRAAGRSDGYAYDVAVNHFAASTGLPFGSGTARGAQLDARSELLPLNFVWRDGEVGEPPGLEVEYSQSIFEHDTVERLLEAFLEVVAQFAENLSEPVSSITVTTERERRQLTRDFATSVATEVSDRSISAQFELQARRSSRRPALIHGTREVSYLELNRRANRLGRALLDAGVRPNDRVAICLERGPDMVAAVLGVLKAGAGYVPLDPAHPAQRIEEMINDSAPSVVLTQSSLTELIGSPPCRVVCLDENEDRLAGFADDDLEGVDHDVADVLYVIYTSGSTGRPKGVAMSRAAASNLLAWHGESMPVAADERTLQFAALGFDVAFQEIVTTLCGGGTLVLVDEVDRRDPLRLLDVIARTGVTRAFLPPAVLSTLAEAAGTSSTRVMSLRDVICAGEPLKIHDAIRLFCSGGDAVRLHNHYGPTETHVVSSLAMGGTPREWPGQPGLGGPVANARLYLLDPDLSLSPLGQVGEIYIGGPGLALGYHGRPALTAERFVSDPYSGVPGGRMYRTGDLGRWRAREDLEFLGRCDRQVKVRGHRIELREIETVLSGLEDVAEAVVSLDSSERSEGRLIAHFRPKPGTSPRPDVVRREVAGLLPAHMVPAAFVKVDAWPMSMNGKIDLAHLPSPGRRDTAVGVYEAPQGETETVLAQVWADVLNLERVGRRDDFFELGGHSLHMVRIAARLKELFDVEIPIIRFSREPNVAALADVVIEQSLAQFDPSEVSRFQAGIETLSAEEIESLLAE